MADTGFVLAGTGADDASVGTRAWSNPGNITASDDNDASTSLFTGDTSHYIKGTNNGISVPAGATIDGIETQLEGDQSVANRFTVSSIKCVRSGTIEGNDNQDGAQWPDNDSTATYGGPTDLWGLSWTVAQVNDSTTGHVWSGTASNNVQARVDAMWRKVYYTEATGGDELLQSRRAIGVP